jgi:hypothetical protein
MEFKMTKALFTLLATGSLFVATAVTPSIGFVKSSGTFRVDGLTIRGNSSLVEGNVVETSQVWSTLEIGGVQIALLPDSRAKVYRDHTLFEKGAGVASGAGAYVIEAAPVRVAPATKDTVVEVKLRGPSGVVVSARNGAASVRSTAGVLLASMRPGETLAFEPEPQGGGASGPVTITGTLTKSGNTYTLTDKTTNVTYQITGKDLEKYVGKVVKVVGSALPGTATGATTIAATTVTTVAAVAGGLSAAAIAGIAIAGATGLGLGVAAANGAFSSSTASSTGVSSGAGSSPSGGAPSASVQ